jgi:hypothetical protein
MKNLSKYLVYLFTVLLSLSACQNVQDGLSGKKKENSDEFLVQKKNPLILPPDYDKLPEPETLKKNSEEEDLEIILGKGLSSINNNSKIKTSNGPLEKSIIEKIKKN